MARTAKSQLPETIVTNRSQIQTKHKTTGFGAAASPQETPGITSPMLRNNSNNLLWDTQSNVEHPSQNVS